MKRIYVKNGNVDEAFRLFKREVKLCGIIEECRKRECFYNKREKLEMKRKANRKNK